MIIQFDFLPPSANKCYYTDFKSKTRHKSQDYKQFIKDFQFYCPKEIIKGEVSIEYNFYYSLYYKNGNRRKIDKNNFEKALSDTLVHYGVIEDDCFIRRTLIESYEGDPYTVIEIKKYA